MILLSMKTYLALLWGISVLFSMESRSASIPETSSSISSTAEPNKTTKQLTTAHVLHTKTEMQPATQDPAHSPAEVSVATTAETAVSATVETEDAVVGNTSDNSTVGLVVGTTEAATTTSSGPRLPHTSTDAPVVTTAASEAQPSHNTTISGSAKPTEQQQSPTTSTDMTAPSTTPSTPPPTTPQTAPAATSETFSVTAAVSSPMSTYITELNVTIKLYSTASSDNSTQAIQNFSSPSTFGTTATSTITTSEASHVFDPDSTSPVTISEASTASTELSSTSEPVSATRSPISTSHLPDTARPSSTTESSSNSTDSANSTTAVSTSLAGILIPRVPKRLPIPTNKSTPATTTAPQEVSKSTLGTEVKTCSIHGVVKHCLIAIASLAGLATIFIVITIILCAKLSVRKYKVKKPDQETEMICISSLLSERSYTRQRSHPVTNGILVLPSCEYSDEDVDDSLTLHSFLPEHDRFH